MSKEITLDDVENDDVQLAIEKLQNRLTIPNEKQRLVKAARTEGISYGHIDADETLGYKEIVADERIPVDYGSNIRRNEQAYDDKIKLFAGTGEAMLALLVNEMNSTQDDYEYKLTRNNGD